MKFSGVAVVFPCETGSFEKKLHKNVTHDVSLSWDWVPLFPGTIDSDTCDRVASAISKTKDVLANIIRFIGFMRSFLFTPAPVGNICIFCFVSHHQEK